MRIGITLDEGDATFASALRQAREAQRVGLSTFWLQQLFGLDALTAAAVLGREVDGLEFGTAVVPSYPRHPAALAQQALTASAATDGRFTLGVGLSHAIVIEHMYGLDASKPARHMREYLEVLAPLLRGESVDHSGDEYRTNLTLAVPGGPPVPLLLAALGPVMLGIAGRVADGTITWMTGPRAIAEHIAPKLTASAEQAGRPAPRIVCGLPIVLTNDEATARAAVEHRYALYGELPSYRAMLDREGAAGPADVALLGDERSLRAQVDRLRDAGVTDLQGAVIPVGPGSAERTIEFMASLG